MFKFALNYRSLIDGNFKQIYRVDNYHGFLHEQMLWRTKKPIPIRHDEHLPIKLLVFKYTNKILSEFKQYKEFYKTSLRK